MSVTLTAITIAVLAVLYFLLVELPAPTFVVHTKGAVVVSGSSSGIGLDAAITLASKGLHVFAGVRKEADGARVAAACEKKFSKESCSTLIPIVLDVTKQETIDSTFATVSKWTQDNSLPFVALFNNAGVNQRLLGPVEALDIEKDFRAVMEVNYFGLVALTQKFLPLIRQHKGRIINHSSGLGIGSMQLFSGYVASKFAVEGFSDSLRKEMRPLGVSVSLLNTGMVQSDVNNHIESIEGNLTPEINSIYSAILSGFDKKFFEMSGLAKLPEDTTTPDVIDAVFSVKPKTRYFPSAVGPVPSVVFAFLCRVLPTHLIDLMALNG